MAHPEQLGGVWPVFCWLLRPILYATVVGYWLTYVVRTLNRWGRERK